MGEYFLRKFIYFPVETCILDSQFLDDKEKSLKSSVYLYMLPNGCRRGIYLLKKKNMIRMIGFHYSKDQCNFSERLHWEEFFSFTTEAVRT